MIPIPRPPSPVQLGADFGRRVSGGLFLFACVALIHVV